MFVGISRQTQNYILRDLCVSVVNHPSIHTGVEVDRFMMQSPSADASTTIRPETAGDYGLLATAMYPIATEKFIRGCSRR